MSKSEREKPRDILGDIDALLAENQTEADEAFRPVSYEEVDALTSLMYRNPRMGVVTDREVLTDLKDTALELLLKRSENNEYLLGSKESKLVRRQFKPLLDMYRADKSDSNIEVQYRDFRSLVLSHVLSTDPETMPEGELQGKVVDIRSRYDSLEKVYKVRTQPQQ